MNRIPLLFLCIICLLGTGLNADDALQSGFRNPPASAKARTWWHWINGNVSKEGITADLEAMKRVGIQEAQIFNVDQGYPEGTADFLSPEWLDLFYFAVQEAKRLDLEIGFHNGAGWSSSGGPWITPEYSMQTVVFSEVNCTGNTSFQGKLSQPTTKLNYYRDIAVLAFPTPQDGTRIDDREIKTLSGHDFRSHLDPDAKEIPSSAVIRLSDIVNLTGNMSADGTLTWNVPPGEWTILRIGHTPNGVENRPAVSGGRGLECDKLSRAAMDVYWAGGIEPILKKLGSLVGTTVTNCLIDSYEVGCNNWTIGFREEFASRRGYDCMAFLPTLAGYYVDGGESSERFLWDFRRTIGDLMAKNYFGYFKELCHKRGMKFSIEPYGGPFDALSAGATGDIPMSEFWVGDNVFMETSKLASSIAHLNGTSIVGAEAFTANGQNSRWLNHPERLKSLGDRMWTGGVNRFIFHTYTHQPWNNAIPGMTFHMYGTEMSRLNTWWEQGRAYMDYLARSQFLLQQGRFVADVLVFVGESSPNAGIYRPDIKMLGYDYDEIGMNKIGSLTVKNGWIHTPVGGVYRLLVLPETTWMSPELARKLSELSKAGATIIGPKPMKSPSLEGFPQCDNEVRRIADEIWIDKTGRFTAKSGQVITNRPVKDVLSDMHLPPDFSGGLSGSDLIFIHRATGDADIYFVANPKKQSRNETCRFRIVGKQPELWNPETGEIQAIAVWKSEGQETSIPLHFDSEASFFVVFRKSVDGSMDPIVQAEVNLDAVETKPLPGLKIIEAKYGVFPPEGVADVTEALNARIKDGSLNVLAGNHLLDSDPAPGIVKELRVEYSMGGQVYKTSVKEMDPIVISHVQGTEALQIKKAFYGRFNRDFDTILPMLSVSDVTEKINRMLVSKQYVFPVDDRLIDKPLSEKGQNKALRLSYSVEGELHQVTVPQGGKVNLACDTPQSRIIMENGTVAWLTPQAGKITCVTASGKTRTAEVKTMPKPVEILGAWDVSFPPNLGAPPRVSFERLSSWTDSSNEGVRYFSGTATYRKKITVSEELVKRGRSLELDLGRVRVIAEVIVNGKNLGILWKEPFRIDLGDAVKAGENELEIRVTNLWPNRLIGDARFPEDGDWGDWVLKRWPDWLINKTERSSQRITFTTWRHWSADSPLQPSGLLGPVILRPYVHATLSE